MTSSNGTGSLASLEPTAVWGYFSRIAAIPRPSRKEERIRQAVKAMAKEKGLTVREDSAHNLLIEVPASPGRENAPALVLQGHLDMVCEKNSDSSHDFDRDPIRLIVACDSASGEQIVRADGTTLGADNGIGVAMALAVASEKSAVHGPLELLFTVDEETGMTGVKALTPDSFKGRRLLNLDSEEDDVLYIGCAGGCDSTLTFEFGLEPSGSDTAYRVAVSGLRGGHSGGDIHENRGNAIKLLVRTLLRAHPQSLRIASISGGRLRNAIPREAETVVYGPPEAFDVLHKAAKSVAEEVVRESAEQRMSIDVERVSDAGVFDALSEEHTWRVLSTLAALPHGVLGMHAKIPGLVETSNNVATVASNRIDGRNMMRVQIGALARSSSESRKRAVLAQIDAIAKLAGATVRTDSDYPGWEPNVDSQTLAACSRVYKRLFEHEPKVTAVHAGLECGIIGQQVGDMDMVSLGPRIEGAHSPDERVYVKSVLKSWKFLLAVLSELADA